MLAADPDTHGIVVFEIVLLETEEGGIDAEDVLEIGEEIAVDDFVIFFFLHGEGGEVDVGAGENADMDKDDLFDAGTEGLWDNLVCFVGGAECVDAGAGCCLMKFCEAGVEED